MDERYVSASIQIVNDFQNESSVSMYVNVLEDIDNIMVTKFVENFLV